MRLLGGSTRAYITNTKSAVASVPRLIYPATNDEIQSGADSGINKLKKESTRAEKYHIEACFLILFSASKITHSDTTRAISNFI